MGTGSSRVRSQQDQQLPQQQQYPGQQGAQNPSAYPQAYPPPPVYRQQGPPQFAPPLNGAPGQYPGYQPQYQSMLYPQGGQYPHQHAPPPLAVPPHTPAQEFTQTATIRNAVNLKKNTLQLLPVPGDPSKLAIHFLIDASSPCSATVFVMATEDPTHACRIIPKGPAPHHAFQYDKGLGMPYPLNGATGPLIDLESLHEQKAAQLGEELIIRLETISEKGLAEGHSLQEIVPGQEQKLWVQSQTTFASIAKDEEGKPVCRVQKQKIWVEGVSYELQEIYGMEHAAGFRREVAEDVEERLCVICLVNDRDTTVLPCRHMCMCHECAQELRKQTSKCPICRNQVESLLHIGMSRRGADSKPDHAAAATKMAEKLNDGQGALTVPVPMATKTPSAH
ncbi:hypothetical protein WJX74_000180 [Apatococcus lobatus]|uniref:RING-type E3 ubiquitin transferase n=1 Tax=Apatococcus lobatus TaxID=904363 RepID=A0AAW1RS00_9CHLO